MNSERNRIYRRDLHLDALRFITETFHELAVQVPPPQLTQTPAGLHMRYREQLIEQALILKLARIVTGLKSIQILLDYGLTQEQGALQRILDDLDEDILFLVEAKITGKTSELHKQYLADFWREIFDDPDPRKSDLDYRAVPRKKIRAHVSRFISADDPSAAVAVGKVLQKGYSGFIHAAASNIMDIYGGYPPRFHVEGLLGTSSIEDYQHNAWDYFYRGLGAAAMTAIALKDKRCFQQIYDYTKRFETFGL